MADVAVTIEYAGDAGSAANELEAALRANGVHVQPARDATPEGGALGGFAEIVLTFVATGLLKASAKTALKMLREFLHERIEAADARLRLRVVVPRPGTSSKKLPFLLEKATFETADLFVENVQKVIDTI